MTLIVETGAGLATAESFASVVDADARVTALGLNGWPATTTEKEQALRRATAYMEQAYAQRWKGTRLLRDQALSWPRYGAMAHGYALGSTTVPLAIVNACIDLALKAAAGDLAPDLSPAVIREKVGPLETEYDRNSPAFVQYRSIDMMLGPYLTGGGGFRLTRA